ncbi:MAG: transglutaminase-like cysteine peptidase [Alphaproteobacteria bacterium]|nr:transglutaminase-like cysteine peptidase [Alphaproteobacteria bacterium]
MAPPMPAFALNVDLSNPAFAATGRMQTSTPIGHAEFCHFHRTECGPNTALVSAVELTPDNWQQLIAINNRFNTGITPVTDAQLYNVAEFWTYPDRFGDCEDFALAKRRALIEIGWPQSTLLITVVRQKNGEGHAVLMVRSDRGDLILDNQDALIRLWTDTPYQYLKRQSQADAGKWVDIVDDDNRLALLER